MITKKQEDLEPTFKPTSSTIYEFADYLTDIIIEIDADKYITYLNHKGCEVFSIKFDDLNREKIRFFDYIASYDRDKLDKHLNDLFMGIIKNPVSIDCDAIKLNRYLFAIHIHATIITFPDNSPRIRIIASQDQNIETKNLYVIDTLIRIGTFTNTLNEYFESFLSVITSEFGFSSCGIYLKDEKELIAKLLSYKNIEKKLLTQIVQIHVNDRYYSGVLHDGVPILLGDIPKDTLGIFETYASLYMFPFFSKGKILGSLLLLSEKRTLISNKEFSIFMTIGQEVGTLIEKMLLEEELYKLSLFALQSPDSIIITNLNGNIEYINPTFTQLTGYTLEEISGKNITFLLTEEGRGLVNFEDLLQATKNGKIKREYFQNHKKNGELYWVYATFSPIINTQGTITSILSIHENVTELKRYTEVINAIISSIPAILIEIDANGIITEFHGQKLKDFNLADNYAIGKSIRDIFPISTNYIDEALNGGKTRFTIDIELNNQQVFFNVDLIFDKIKGKGAIGLAIDITEEKLSEMKLIESEKITALGEFIAGIAHEINNPLSYIKNNSELITNYYDTYTKFFTHLDQLISAFNISNDFKSKLAVLKKDLELEYINHEFRDVLKENNVGLELIQRTVTDLQMYSKMDHEEKAFRKIDINEIITSAIRMISYKEKRRITFEQNLAQDSFIYGQTTRLSQVFLNLIKNASEAITEGGIIRVTSRKIGNHLEINIWDNGTGIDPKILPRLFKPFFTTKLYGKGTGLGLTISKSIIEEHKGSISVQSETGKYTEFTILFPLNQLPEHG